MFVNIVREQMFLDIIQVNPKVATHPSLGSADVALLGVDNGSGYSANEFLIQHLCMRLMRKYGWVWLMWAAEAPYHSSWHWQSEQRWSLVRRCIQGKHFGRSSVPQDP